MVRGRIADIRYRVIPVADPAAGANATHVASGQFNQLIRTLVATFTTDATVANRLVRVTVTDGSTEHTRTHAGATQAASLTHTYAAYSGAQPTAATSNEVLIGWPTDGLLLRSGHVFTVDVENLQAGDQLSDIALHALEFETGWVAPGLPAVPIFIPEFDPTYVG